MIERPLQLTTPLYGGRYELLSLIGVGGGGSVYRARDVELDETVALKVLRKELLHAPSTLERFRNEVRLARRVTHRNIARVFDIGEHEGERFLTMELVEGESLTRHIAAGEGGPRTQLTLARVAALVEQVCAGLEAAHQSGVVHCDLKPDNLLISKDAQGERVVITDFGIARALSQPAAKTSEQRTFDGTPMYVSPESVQGQPIDSRADLYSLGVVMYELLIGVPPFPGESVVAVVAARVLRPPPDPRQLRPELPAAAAEVVLRCMARDPAERFQRAVEVARALRQAAEQAAHEPTRRHPVRAAVAPPAPRISAASAAPSPLSTDDTLVNAQTIVPLPGASSRSAIAVLPLHNHGISDDEYLAEGLSQELIDALSELKGVRVYSRAALARFRDRADDPLAIGRELECSLIVDGSFQRSGEHWRIELHILSMADGQRIFSQRFDCRAGDLQQVSDALIAAVADALVLTPPQSQRIMPVASDAVEQYLRARHLYGRSERASIEESVRLFEKVLAQAEDEPTLLLGYALARARLWFFGDGASGDKARVAAERAVAVAPRRAESHLALAVVRFQAADLSFAVHALQQALAHAPELADAHDLLGRILIETGPIRDGLVHLTHARALDPGLLQTLLDHARVAALLDDYKRAEALLSDHQLDGISLGGQWMLRGRLCMWSQDRRRAEELLTHTDMERGLYPRARLLLQVAAGQVRVDPKDVLFGPQGSDNSSPRGRTYFYQMHTEIFSFYGDHELAVRSLARSVDAGLHDLLYMERCPLIKALAKDPRVSTLRRIVSERAHTVREAAAPVPTSR